MTGLFLLALELLKRNWRACVLVAFACAVAAALLYAHHRVKEAGRAEGRAEIQAKLDAAIAQGREAVAAVTRQNAAKSAKAAKDAQAAQDRQNERNRQALADKDRLVADLQRGTVQLRQQWSGCVSASRAREAGAAAESDAAELRGEGPQSLVGAVADQIYDDDQADAEITLWQSIAQAQQEACTK